MNDLQSWANLAEILGAATIVGGALFALVQIREFREQRRLATTIELIQSFHSPAFARAVSIVRALPEDPTAEQIRAAGPEFEEAAVLIATTYETIGLLVFRELTSFSLVRDLTGGIAAVMWRKLSGWLVVVREEQQQPSFAEWFEWLARQLIRDSESKEANPAYERHASWQPRD